MSQASGDGRRRTFLVGLVGVAATVFVVLAAVFWIGSNTDGAVGESGAGWVDAAGLIGSFRVLPALTLVVAGALAATGHRDEALVVLAAVVGVGLLSYGAKVVLQVVGADDDGGRLSDYPSGHTAATTALLGALTVIVFWRSRDVEVRVLASGVAAAAIVAMAFARVEGGGHTWLDALGGIALGLCWLSLCLLLLPWARVPRPSG